MQNLSDDSSERSENFRKSIQELRKTECSPGRLKDFAAYLINRVNKSHADADRDVASDCLVYFNSLETCTLNDMLEISYILNGGVMLKSPTQCTAFEPLDTEDEATVDTGTAEDSDADREFQRLISEFEETSVGK